MSPAQSNSSGSTSPNLLLSLDTLFAFPFLGVYIALYRDPKGVVLSALLIAYLIIDIFWPWHRLTERPAARNRLLLGKLALILVAIGLVAFFPTATFIAERLRTGSPQLVSDSMAQIEVGLDFLSQGLNPYAQDFSDTFMAQIPFELSGITQSPSLQHFAYLPFSLEFSYPFYLVFIKFIGWWDQRILYMVMLVVSLGAVMQITRNSALKLCLVMLIGLNPMLMPAFSAGMNEIFPLMWLILSAILLNQGRPTLGWIMLALAVVSKQTAWFVPVFAVTHFLFEQIRAGRAAWRENLSAVLRQTWPAIAIALLSIIPFIVWDARAFAEDTFGFLVGATSQPAIIAGVGLGGLLLNLGVIHNALDNYPFGLWQLAIGGPLLIALLYHQFRHRDLRFIWIYGACLGVTLTFLSRVFADRYFGFYLVVAAIGALADSQKSAQQSANK